MLRTIKLMDWLKLVLENKDKILPKFIRLFLTDYKTICLMFIFKCRNLLDNSALSRLKYLFLAVFFLARGMPWLKFSY